MCGKFTQSMSWSQLVNVSDALVPTVSESSVVVTPMSRAHVIGVGDDGRRWVKPMIWGFVENSRLRHIHARGETLDCRPSFRRWFTEGRGVVMVRTFNEADEPRPGRIRQWVVNPGANQEIAIAVVFRKQQLCHGLDHGFVQITRPANSALASVSDRMPAVLDPGAVAVWLGEAPGSAETRMSLLQTYPDDAGWMLSAEDAVARPSSGAEGRQLSLF